MRPRGWLCSRPRGKLYSLNYFLNSGSVSIVTNGITSRRLHLLGATAPGWIRGFLVSSDREPLYHFVRGQGWILKEHHSDLLEIVDERADTSIEGWHCYEVRHDRFCKNWTDQWRGRRWRTLDVALVEAERNIKRHTPEGWIGRIRIIDKDSFCV